MIHQWRQVVAPGDLVFDIGANVGTMTRQFAEAVGPTGRVVAFEPTPETFATLRQSFGGAQNISVLGLAVTDTPMSETAFWANPKDSRQNSRWSILAPGATRVGSRTDGFMPHRVGTASVDKSAATFGHPALIKVDTQGGELDVLRGATATIARGCAWFIELWTEGYEAIGLTVAEVIAPLRDAGYQPVTKELTTWEAVLAHSVKRRAGFDVLVLPPQASPENGPS